MKAGGAQERSGIRERPLILVVDDDRTAPVTTAAILEDDFTVLTASNGQAALDLLERREIDVLCTDYEMPGLNGAELLRVMFARFPGVGAVVITGQRDFLSRPSINCGPGRVFDILLKPLDGDQLLRTVARALERGRVAREIERRRPATR